MKIQKLVYKMALLVFKIYTFPTTFQNMTAKPKFSETFLNVHPTKRQNASKNIEASVLLF